MVEYCWAKFMGWASCPASQLLTAEFSCSARICIRALLTFSTGCSMTFVFAVSLLF